MFHFGFVSRANELKDFQIHEFPFASPLQYFLSLYVLCLGRCFVALTQIKILVSSLTHCLFKMCLSSLFLSVKLVVNRSTITIVSDEKNDLILQKIYVDDMVNLKIIHCKERTNNLTENI